MNKFIFSTDFVILEYEVDHEVSVILRQSFLSTGLTFIDVHQEELTMRLNDQEVTFNIVKGLKFFSNVENGSTIKSLGWDYIAKKYLLRYSSLKKSLKKKTLKVFWKKLTSYLTQEFKPLDLQTKGDRKNKPSIEEPPELY